MVGGQRRRASLACQPASQFQPAPASSARRRRRPVPGSFPGPASARFPPRPRKNARGTPDQTPKSNQGRIDQSTSQSVSQSDSVSQQSADRPMDRSAQRWDSGLRPSLSGDAPIASRVRAGRLPPSAPGSAPSPPLPPSARARRARRGSRGGVWGWKLAANIPHQNASVQDVQYCTYVRWSACLLGLRVYEPSMDMDGRSARQRRPRKRRRRATQFGFYIVGFI